MKTLRGFGCLVGASMIIADCPSGEAAGRLLMS
jgi:hypothetical protein